MCYYYNVRRWLEYEKEINFVTLSLLVGGLLVGTVSSSAQAETTTNVNITKVSSVKTNAGNLFVSLSELPYH